MAQSRTVVVLGASNKPHRYAYRAITMLLDAGYPVIPVHPKLDQVQNILVRHDLTEIDQPIDTLTLYLGEGRSRSLIEKIVQLKPKRVIFNPGSESDRLEAALDAANIKWEHACTLVLLSSNQF